MRQLLSKLVPMGLAIALVAATWSTALGYHNPSSSYKSGNLGQCYRQGYIYSKASNYVDHHWKDLGWTWWHNAVKTYRSNFVPTPTWWAVDWDHAHDYSGATCTD
ncbi:hypothetical protein BH23CHL10_BH23CHL10_13710 [soil metagenome]